MTSVHDWDASNPVKTNRSGLIGKGVDRYEGPLKVTGTAPYAYEVQPPSPPAYGVMVGAEIASGRITGVDIAEAEAQPGVLAVWTHANAPEQAPRGSRKHPRSTAGSRPALSEVGIEHLLPGRRVDLGRLGQHSVEIEEARPNLVRQPQPLGAVHRTRILR